MGNGGWEGTEGGRRGGGGRGKRLTGGVDAQETRARELGGVYILWLVFVSLIMILVEMGWFLCCCYWSSGGGGGGEGGKRRRPAVRFASIKILLLIVLLLSAAVCFSGAVFMFRCSRYGTHGSCGFGDSTWYRRAQRLGSVESTGRGGGRGTGRPLTISSGTLVFGCWHEDTWEGEGGGGSGGEK